MEDLIAIHSSDVVPFFKKKGVKEECECCGKYDWTVLNDITEATFRHPYGNGLVGFPIVAIECVNCGNIRFFSRERMKLEKDKNNDAG